MADISSFGLRMVITASTTYPNGVELTNFPDDTDPFDIPAAAIAGAAMSMNGEQLTWAVAASIPFNVAVIPNSESDRVLANIYEANRPARGKVPARDVITASIFYPNGAVVTLLRGVMLEGMGASAASTTRLKTKTYNFSFEDRTNADAPGV